MIFFQQFVSPKTEFVKLESHGGQEKLTLMCLRYCNRLMIARLYSFICQYRFVKR